MSMLKMVEKRCDIEHYPRFFTGVHPYVPLQEEHDCLGWRRSANP